MRGSGAGDPLFTHPCPLLMLLTRGHPSAPGMLGLVCDVHVWERARVCWCTWGVWHSLNQQSFTEHLL